MEDFVYDARRTLAEALVDARGLSGRKSWYNCTRRKAPDNWLRYQLQEPVRTTYQFFLLPRDGAIVPHADAPRKLVSLLLYFRDPEWEDAWGGGTEFYLPLDSAKARRWGPTDRIPFEEFEPIVTTEFRGNRLAGFVRSANSYHGVRPVTLSRGHGSQGPPDQHQASQVVQATHALARIMLAGAPSRSGWDDRDRRRTA